MVTFDSHGGPFVASNLEFLAPRTKVAWRRQFRVGNDEFACEWRWLPDDPAWRMSSREGGRCVDGAALTEEGRMLILAHFLLYGIEKKLPLERISGLSPATLYRMRRAVENHHSFWWAGIPPSSGPGKRVDAESCD